MKHGERFGWGVGIGLLSLVGSTACRSASLPIVARPPAKPHSLALPAPPAGEASTLAGGDSELGLTAPDSLPGPPGWDALRQDALSLDEDGTRALPGPAPEEDGWRFLIAPYGWLLSLDGDATVKGTRSDIDYSFSDILDNLSFVVETRFEAWKGRWGFLGDITYARLKADIDEGPVNGDATTNLVLGIASVAYTLKAKEKPTDLQIDGTAGFLYTYMHGDLDLDQLPNADGNEDWFDPLVGFRMRKAFNEKWGGHLGLALGGFGGVTGGSDFSYLGDALLGRFIGKKGNKVLYVGYRVLGIDYDNDRSGDKQFEFDVTIQGPIVGFEWSF